MPLKYKHTILLVDDEVSITKSLQRLFRKEGFTIYTASNGEEGLAVLQRLGRRVSLIISDQRMPGMTGAQFLAKTIDMAPDATRFLLTGYSDMDSVVEAVNKGQIHRYLTKPWKDDELRFHVFQALGQYELILENRRLTLLTGKQNKALKGLNNDLEKRVRERSKEILEKNQALSSMNEELESGLFNAVRAFTALAEIHTPLLSGHGRRVSLMAREIAEGFALPENEVTHIEIAALLHDVGKLGLPENVLQYQENSWNEEDKKSYRNHPEEGQLVVRFIKRLDHVGLLIRSHHERYDGLGFPDRLSEDVIPLGSKIIAVANVYDKVAHMKVDSRIHIAEYCKEEQMSRDHLPEEDLIRQAALFHIKQQAFTRYDPDVVKCFMEILRTKGIGCKKEQYVSPEKLQRGMVLSRSIYTKGGRFLLPHNTTLTDEYIQKLRSIFELDPSSGGVYVIED
jgi:response regulator RpfG family c-di-GMP phosphodiesterase